LPHDHSEFESNGKYDSIRKCFYTFDLHLQFKDGKYMIILRILFSIDDQTVENAERPPADQGKPSAVVHADQQRPTESPA